jgi:cell division protein FtsB
VTTETLRGRFRMPHLGIGPQIVVLLLVLGLMGAMAIQPTRQLLEQRARMRDASRDLAAVNESNRRLQNRIQRLKDPDYVDQLARAQSGLVKPGEIPYVVMPPSRSGADRRNRPAPAEVPVQESPSFMQSLLHFIGVS